MLLQCSRVSAGERVLRKPASFAVGMAFASLCAPDLTCALTATLPEGSTIASRRLHDAFQNLRIVGLDFA
jgi:hypothetical protein